MTSEASTFRDKRQWFEVLVAIGLYVCLALMSAAASIGRTKYDLELRFGFVLPIALMVSVGMFFRVAPWLRKAGILIASCVAGSVEIVIYGTHRTNEEAIAQIAVVGVLVFTNTVMKLNMPYVIASLCWGVGAEYFLLMPKHGSTLQAQYLSSAMVFAVAVLTFIANHSQEREARLALLRHAEQKDLVTVLAESNEHFAAAARTDSLTGLANRSALDEYLEKVWSEPALAGATCSAVMVDIDHFKNLNDRYGHLYGDRVLKRVAHLLAEALRGEDDFIARFGGEEFVVILPRTPAHLALIVAERLRALVELAGLPSVRAGDPSLQGIRATISCGVAAAKPHFYPDPYVLIQTADEALYQAKRDVRNLVRGLAATTDYASISSAIENEIWR